MKLDAWIGIIITGLVGFLTIIIMQRQTSEQIRKDRADASEKAEAHRTSVALSLQSLDQKIAQAEKDIANLWTYKREHDDGLVRVEKASDSLAKDFDYIKATMLEIKILLQDHIKEGSK